MRRGGGTARTGRDRRSVQGLGAVTAQSCQALGSLLLQVVVARTLGAEGLAHFALVFGVVVLLSGLVTGLVGDSLTVLPRSLPAVRRGLQVWTTWVVLLGAGAVLAVVLLPVLPLDGAEIAVPAAAAAAAFVLEEVARRLLMAELLFWRVVVVDAVAATVALTGALVVAAGTPTLAAFCWVLAGAQVLGLLTAVALLPRHERWWARGVRPDLAAVWAFGSWRAAQQMLRPGSLTVLRLVVIAAAGAGVYGSLEAARIVIAPAMLVVSGLTSFLFSSYAKDSGRPLAQLLRRADRVVVLLVAVTVVLAGAAVLALPLLSELVTGGDFTIGGAGVVAWATYAAATAAATPYGSLAAARGRPAAVLCVRTADSVLGLVLVGAWLLVGGDPQLAPVALALGTLVGAATLRGSVLARPPTLAPDPSSPARSSTDLSDSHLSVPGTARDRTRQTMESS